MMSPEELDQCYRILELEPGSTPDKAKKAYRDLVKVWHPDRFASDSELQQKANEKLKRLNYAFEALNSFVFSAEETTETKAETKPSPTQEAGPSKAQTSQQFDSQSVGRHFTKKTRIVDKETGLFRYSVKDTLVTGFDGRWRTEKNTEYLSIPVDVNASTDEARNQSRAFRSKPEQGRRTIHKDYASQLGPDSEIYGSSDEYLFDDGSKIICEGIEIDTLFRDPIAKQKWNAAHPPEPTPPKRGCLGTLVILGIGIFASLFIAVLFLAS